MAPTKFQIYVDQSIRQTTTTTTTTSSTSSSAASKQTVQQQDGDARGQQNQPCHLRYKPEDLQKGQRFYFDERKLYPASGGEYSFEEINLISWLRRQKQLAEQHRLQELQRENEELRQKLEELSYQNNILANSNKQLQQQLQSLQAQPQHSTTKFSQQGPPSPTLTHNRLSIVPQSLQPTQGLETDMSFYVAMNNAPSIVQELFQNTFHDKTTVPIDHSMCEKTLANDKFTVPIDQSQYIRENVPTSTPTHRQENDKRNNLNNRRMSRPSMGGSPTLKLSPITETSRDCNSKSSSSSSALSNTPGTAKKVEQQVPDQQPDDEPEQPLDPQDPTTFRCLLRGLAEPLDRRCGYYKLSRSVPKMRQGACFEAGSDRYLVDKELSHEPKIFTAQLLTDESNDSVDLPIKTISFRVDQPANEWLFYICSELHRRLVKQKTKPDIELSVMMANPAVMYSDGSVLVDEYSRFVTLQDFIEACKHQGKLFPRSVAAYITLELIQLVRQMHTCDIIHTNITTKNLLITCCPTRDDVAKVDERTSIVKLIGFEQAMDIRLLSERLPQDMIEEQPWCYEVDWRGVLASIYRMFFLEDMVDEQPIDSQKFKGFPTNVWSSMFEELSSVGKDLSLAISIIERAVEELNTWVKANITFVLKEADSLDRVLEDYCKATMS